MSTPRMTHQGVTGSLKDLLDTGIGKVLGRRHEPPRRAQVEQEESAPLHALSPWGFAGLMWGAAAGTTERAARTVGDGLSAARHPATEGALWKFLRLLILVALFGGVIAIVALITGVFPSDRPSYDRPTEVSEPVAQPESPVVPVVPSGDSSAPAANPAPAPAAPLAPAPVAPDLFTFVGELDLGAGASQMARTNSITLKLPAGGGKFDGQVLIELDYPIGAIHAAVGKGATGVEDPRDKAWESCKNLLRMKGVVNGTYEMSSGAVIGTVEWSIEEVDVNNCMKDAPPTYSAGESETPPAQRLHATVEENEVGGTILADEESTAFRATKQ